MEDDAEIVCGYDRDDDTFGYGYGLSEWGYAPYAAPEDDGI